MRAAILSFTKRGGELARRIESSLGADIIRYDREQGSAADFVAQAFQSCDALIFVSAAGIAVRLIAPHIRSKDKDPAVVVAGEDGRFVIPILSGHIGGANDIARKLAAGIGAEAVITTATDINGRFAIDEWAAKNGCVIGDISMIKVVSGELLDGKEISIKSDYPLEMPLPRGFSADTANETGVLISADGRRRPFAKTLNIIPKTAVIGAGCKRGTDAGKFAEFVEKNADMRGVRAVATIDVKKDEECIRRFAEKHGIELITFSAEELKAQEGDFHGSAFVEKTVGTDNVCERSAVAATHGGRIILEKTALDGMTVAAAVDDKIFGGWDE